MTNGLTRRGFVGLAGTAMAGARVQPANDRINICQIGIGARGGYHPKACLRRQQSRGDVQVAAVCDVYRKRLAKAAGQAAGAKSYLIGIRTVQRSGRYGRFEQRAELSVGNRSGGSHHRTDRGDEPWWNGRNEGSLCNEIK
jgi:hypothetical protein